MIPDNQKIEGNTIIAKFMGAVVNPDFTDESTFRFPKGSLPYYACRNWTPADMRYLSDWNWLMLAVDKIEHILEKDDALYYALKNREVNLEAIEGFSYVWMGFRIVGLHCAVTRLKNEDKLEAIWVAVLYFINFCNKYTPTAE